MERKIYGIFRLMPALVLMGAAFSLLPTGDSLAAPPPPRALSPEGPYPRVVEAVWTDETKVSEAKLKMVGFDLVSRVDETVYVDAEGIYMGLGDQQVIDALGSYRLKPFESKRVSIDIRDLGVQSASNSSEVIVRLRIERDDGKIVTHFSTPLFYHFDDTYKSVLAYDEEVLLHTYNGGKIAADPFVATGFKKDKSGQLVYVDKSAVTDAVQSASVREDLAEGVQGNVLYSAVTTLPDGSADVVDDAEWRPAGEAVVADSEWRTSIDAAALEYVMTPLSNANVKICGRWNTHFEDSGIGEDIWASSSDLFHPAAYTLVTIYTASWEYVIQGYTDASGCTPTLSLAPGNYVMEMRSDLQRYIGGSWYKYRVRWLNNGTLVHKAQEIGFSVASGDTGSKYLYPTYYYGYTNLNAIAGRILSLSGPIIKPATYRVWYGVDCPGYTDGSSCFSPEVNDLGPVYISAPAVVEKFVITHELGHQASYEAYGAPYFDYSLAYSGDPNTPWICRCDHVTTYNQEHCLQSREYTTTSITEGVGYFWSARIWNNADAYGCTVGHPKQVKFPDGTVHQPPYPMDCRNPVLWKYTKCPQSSDTGTEWDWTQFFWGLHAVSGAYNVPMLELYDLMYRACGNEKCNSGSTADTVTWSVLQNAAIAKWGGTSQQFVEFSNAANATGVNQ